MLAQRADEPLHSFDCLMNIVVVFDERIDGPAHPSCPYTPGKLTVYSIAAYNAECPPFIAIHTDLGHPKHLLVLRSTNNGARNILSCSFELQLSYSITSSLHLDMRLYHIFLS